ncbi:MAG: hypothetical protein JO235_22665 [Chroococcidiopsidaceae cyanobacterium CP_BM_RX_35]|nr:hypothetical protein [Chroococcidiopsidaceae cyanobacterium CP_BM_RX_35]
MSKPLDTQHSIEISKRINSKTTDCFNNAYKAALLIEGSTYVQGFLAFSGKPYTPVEYSWIELDEGIVDPTMPHLNKDPQDLYYFPAQRLTVQQLKAAVEEAKEDYPEDDSLPIYGIPPYEYYGELMLGGKDYEEAYKEAKAKCAELNKPKIQETN